MTLAQITAMQVQYSGATVLSGGAIDTTDGAKILNGADRPILVFVNNTGVAGNVTILAGTLIADAPLLAMGNQVHAIGGTSTGIFLVESARHNRSGDISISFGAGMAGFVYAIELQDRSL